MSQTTTPTQTRPKQNRRGGRNHRGSAKGMAKEGSRGGHTSTPNLTSETSQPESAVEPSQSPNDAEDEDVCWICAEPVKYYSVSTCNHRTCHVCAVRLRALYKKQECTFCKTAQPSLVFTASADALYESFDLETMKFNDKRLSIYFEEESMRDETMILLKFNCPDSTCVYVATAGWNDLKLHVRSTHGKLMCDLCIKFKKVFAHEHALYAPNHLPLHLPSIPHRTPKNLPKDIEGGVHPLCEFCVECLFSGDELFSHMRERHEECFVCKRAGVRDMHFKDYPALELHFKHAHHPCNNPACLVQKFVVFGSPLDLQAHMVEEHGSEMTTKDRREAMRIQADFEFQEVGGSNRRGRRERGDREREREPPPVAAVTPRNGVLRRREGLDTTLTTEPPATASGSAAPISRPISRRPSPSPPGQDVDPVVARKHADFLRRLQSLLPNSSSAISALRAAIRSYRASESAAKDLISTCWNVLDQDLDKTASVVLGVVELLEDEEKKNGLLAAWNGFKVEQRRQFPDLVPSTTPGYSNAVNGLVLSAKHSTSTRSRPSNQVWDRVARAASYSSSPSPVASSSRAPTAQTFPSFQPSSQLGSRQPQRTTPWASSVGATRPAASTVATPVIVSQNVSSNGAKRPPKLSESQFPGLPANSSALPKNLFSGNKSVKNIAGEVAPSVWSGETSASGDTKRTEEAVERSKKKGKGKQKQTLFTMGVL